MNILIANDDGIRADGICALVKALSAHATVYVAAPHVQRSASGHSITINQPLAVRELPFEGAQLALEITGTPADCVKLGINLLRQKGIEIDMVFSGINHGGNLGTDTLYSGTVSAAVEGCFCGYPSVAVSVNNHAPSDFSYAVELAVKVLKKAAGKLDRHTVLNVNIPDLPADKIKGVKYTRLGAREYDEVFQRTETVFADGGLEYRYSATPVIYTDLPEDIDVIAMQNGYATITPLQYDLTNHKLIEEIKSWRIEE